LRFDILKPKFPASELTSRLASVFGDMRLDDPRLKTGLAIVPKRLDTGRPWWIITNNPNSPVVAWL
jgi:uncharacterized protein